MSARRPPPSSLLLREKKRGRNCQIPRKEEEEERLHTLLGVRVLSVEVAAAAVVAFPSLLYQPSKRDVYFSAVSGGPRGLLGGTKQIENIFLLSL